MARHDLTSDAFEKRLKTPGTLLSLVALGAKARGIQPRLLLRLLHLASQRVGFLAESNELHTQILNLGDLNRYIRDRPAP